MNNDQKGKVMKLIGACLKWQAVESSDDYAEADEFLHEAADELDSETTALLIQVLHTDKPYLN